MIRPENNAKGRNLHAPDREEPMRIYLFDQLFVNISSPSSTSDFAITLSIVPLLNSLASVKTFSLFSRNDTQTALTNFAYYIVRGIFHQNAFTG